MLILLPPSEGKTRPVAGAPLDLDALCSPRLNRTREQLLNALVRLSGTRRGAEVLGLGPTQAAELAHNITLRTAPAAPAETVYTGVLFGELDLPGLSAAARDRAADRVAITSSVFGLLRPQDRIPAYRMSGGTTLPRLGTVASRWKPVLGRAADALADGGLVLDLRSGTYAAFGTPSGPTATVRVLHEADGRRSVVSHFNKATKGRVARALLEDGRDPASVDELVDLLRDLGHEVEVAGSRLDIVTR